MAVVELTRGELVDLPPVCAVTGRDADRTQEWDFWYVPRRRYLANLLTLTDWMVVLLRSTDQVHCRVGLPLTERGTRRLALHRRIRRLSLPVALVALLPVAILPDWALWVWVPIVALLPVLATLACPVPWLTDGRSKHDLRLGGVHRRLASACRSRQDPAA